MLFVACETNEGVDTMDDGAAPDGTADTPDDVESERLAVRAAPPAEAPIPISPIGDFREPPWMFIWTEVAGAAEYWLIISDRPTYNGAVILYENGDVLDDIFGDGVVRFPVPAGVVFETNKPYYWKVKSIAPGGVGMAWSAYYQFTIIP